MVILTSDSFIIKEKENHWTIRYSNIDSIDLSKKLLFEDKNTKKLSRQERLEFTLEAHSKGQFGALSLPEQHLIIESAYDNRNNPQYKEQISNLQIFLKKQFEKHSLETLSYIVNFPEPSSKSMIIHNPGILDEESLEEQTIGKDSPLTEIEDRIQLSQTFFKKSNYGNIDSVYEWLTGSQVNVWRANEKPMQRERKVIALGTYLGKFYLIANATLNINRPTLGIRKLK